MSDSTVRIGAAILSEPVEDIIQTLLEDPSTVEYLRALAVRLERAEEALRDARERISFLEAAADSEMRKTYGEAYTYAQGRWHAFGEALALLPAGEEDGR